MALIITFSPEVQEISIAGNVIKLREIRSKAEKTIKQLRLTQIQVLKFLLGVGGFLRPAHPFALDNPTIAPEFWNIIDECRSIKGLKPLKDDLIKVIDGFQMHLLVEIGPIRPGQQTISINSSMSKADVQSAVGKPDMVFLKDKWGYSTGDGEEQKITLERMERFLEVKLSEYLKLSELRREISRL
jgi:hypothetical protein